MLQVRREASFVGGHCVEDAGKQVMVGQMLVEALTPAKVTHPLLLALLHGLAQTPMNCIETPDGRQGWADWFAAHGWQVLVVD